MDITARHLIPLTKGQISFMNVTADVDGSTHLSQRFTLSLPMSEPPTPPPPQLRRPPPPRPQQMRGTPVNSAPFETMKAKPHVNVSVMNGAYRRVHYSFSATFVSEYQMNMINVQHEGGSGGSSSHGGGGIDGGRKK